MEFVQGHTPEIASRASGGGVDEVIASLLRHKQTPLYQQQLFFALCKAKLTAATATNRTVQLCAEVTVAELQLEMASPLTSVLTGFMKLS